MLGFMLPCSVHILRVLATAFLLPLEPAGWRTCLQEVEDMPANKIRIALFMLSLAEI